VSRARSAIDRYRKPGGPARLREVQGLRRPPSMWQFRPEHPAQGDFWLSPVRPFVQVWDGEKWIEVQGE